MRFDAAGQALGNFQANTFTTGIQNLPSVAMNSSGQFVIAWRSNDQDGAEFGIYAQRYAADGSAVGAEFQVNTFTTGAQSGASVAMGPDGRFVIVWTSAGQDGSQSGVYAQRYAADGTAAGSEFRVNTTTNDYQANPAVAIHSNGNFVVSWESNNQDGDSYGVFAQRYNSEGLAQGAEFQVNTITSGSQSFPALAMMANESFGVVWQGHDIDGNNTGIAGKRFNAQGAAL